MAIHVRTMGILSVEMPGQVTIELGPADGLTLRSLIFDRLASEEDDRLPGALFDAQDRLQSGYAILVDGRNAMQLGGLDLFVRDGATVLITALVSGG
jgi:molybdopterin converting factor small subunit